MYVSHGRWTLRSRAHRSKERCRRKPTGNLIAGYQCVQLYAPALHGDTAARSQA